MPETVQVVRDGGRGKVDPTDIRAIDCDGARGGSGREARTLPAETEQFPFEETAERNSCPRRRRWLSRWLLRTTRWSRLRRRLLCRRLSR